MIANNHTKLKETQTTKLDALLHVANNFANFNDLKRACHQFQWPSALVVQLFEAHEDVPPRVGVFTVTTVTARSSLSTSPTGLTNCFLNFIQKVMAMVKCGECGELIHTCAGIKCSSSRP